MENPWEDIEARYPSGAKVHGKVVNLAPYGAFIELEEGVEGLVHVSEISWTKRVQRASDELSLGQEVDAVVLSVSTEDKKYLLVFVKRKKILGKLLLENIQLEQ